LIDYKQTELPVIGDRTALQ